MQASVCPSEQAYDRDCTSVHISYPTSAHEESHNGPGTKFNRPKITEGDIKGELPNDAKALTVLLNL